MLEKLNLPASSSLLPEVGGWGYPNTEALGRLHSKWSAETSGWPGTGGETQDKTLTSSSSEAGLVRAQRYLLGSNPSHCASLGLSLPFCKMGIKILPPPPGWIVKTPRDHRHGSAWHR